MRSFFWGTAAALTVVGAEILMKSLPGGYWRHWYLLVPLAVLINWLLYLAFQASPNLPAVVIVFTAVTWIVRVPVSLWAGHLIGTGTWVAIGLMLLAVGFRAWRP